MSALLAGQAPLLSAAVVLLIGFVLYQKWTLHLRRQQFKKQHKCQPATAKYSFRDPILHTDFIRETIAGAKKHQFLLTAQRRFAKYGNTFQAYLIRKPILVTCDARNIKAVLSTNFKDYALGPNRTILLSLLGKGIFTTDGEEWSHSRQLLRPNFSKDQVGDIVMFERHVQELLAQVPTDGSTVDLQDLFFRLTIDSATEFLFGESIGSQRQHNLGDNTLESTFGYAFNWSQQHAAHKARIGFLANFYYDKKAKVMEKICHDFTDRYVESAVQFQTNRDLEKAPKDNRYVFAHELAKQTTDKKRLRTELLNVLLAGRDTTASLLANMFFMLAKQRETWKKLREELENELHGEIPTYEQLRNLKYLKWCMNESLRLHPLVPTNGRTVMKDTVLPVGGGADGESPLFVPAGTLVVYSAFALHRRKDIYGEDAEEFRPERWETLRPSWEYLPFNGGPRICLGQQYALTEAGYVTCRLVQEFERCESRDNGPWEESLSLTLSSKNGTRVGLYRS